MEDKNKKITEIQTEIVTIKEEVAKGMSICHKQRTDLTAVERELIDLQQYVRRNNVEICNLPESIKDDDLESTVIDIGKAVDIDIKRRDVEAVQRLKPRKNENGPRRTIVRFKNRKICEALLRSSKEFHKSATQEKANLSDKIFINSNLSNYNRLLWGKSKALLKGNKIHKFWSFNGNIHIKINENDNPLRIGHINDLISKFPNCNYLRPKDNNDES